MRFSLPGGIRIRILLAALVAIMCLAVSPAAALAGTAPSTTISGAQALPVGATVGPSESGGGHDIDYWKVTLSGGDQMLINYANAQETLHFELYAPGTTDANFAQNAPVSSSTNENGFGGVSGQSSVTAPYNGTFILAICQNPNDGDCRSIDTGTVTDPMATYQFTPVVVSKSDPTSTAVSCASSSVTAGSSTTCTAQVTDTASTGANTPTGTVGFSAIPASASFGNSGSCTLAPASTTGDASCQISFTPLAAGSYTISGSYNGDSDHQASGGQSPTVTATSAIGPTPGPNPGRPSVGHPSVSGTTASVLIRCQGNGSCSITLTLSILETVKHGKKRSKTIVVVGSAKVTIAAGKSKTIELSLDATGKRLLAKHDQLKTKLTAKSGKLTASFTITFEKAHKHHKRH